ncbi:MAG: hydrophobe/amphiphile efflux-1 family RND transporter [Deltaproteobacteria bacterium HGW-Deltaproteobacteria-14]|nr:MAG: hydrophobe/amphiphile efflux-1 family RND transporter [Deltaproteobacteria bacterium HGW-Deltaproteobacteria-14]
MARFFIDRPIFATVIAIIIMLAGGAAVLSLPVAQYPNIAPTSVSINASYPGASANTVEDSVTQIIEQKMKGLDGLLYMSSSSSSSGGASVTLTFAAGTDPDIAQVQVQNKLQLAVPFLPTEVQRQGIQVTKSGEGFLMVVAFVSEDGRMSQVDLGDYVATNVSDVLSRVEGVGNVQIFGGSYAMRIWLDPGKLEAYRLTPGDVSQAVRAQNTQISAGQLGETPAIPGQQLNATISAQSRLSTPEQFRQILLRTDPDGSVVRLGDVARVELGAEGYGTVSRFNGMTATGIAIIPATGANALDTAAAVRAKLRDVEQFFPPGMKAVVAYDVTPFVEVSIDEVVVTLFEAVGLVFLVMFIFLQSIRATLIPTIAVPVVLLGTFAILQAFGFSINTLTMFAMVLAIGLLVDDAIVVVENVERIMREEGLNARDATRKSMDQITSALIGITLVLSAVFVPMAFFGGSVGVIYQQFSVTIVSAMVLSVLVALTLTPALCATILKHTPGHGTRGLAGLFNRAFDRGTRAFRTVVAHLIRRSIYYLLLFGGLTAATALLFQRLPTSFLPNEDQGLLITVVQGPVGATQERTMKVVHQIEDYFLSRPDTFKSMFAIAGFSFGGSGQNTAIAFVRARDWSERTTPDTQMDKLVQQASGRFWAIKDGMVFAIQPPVLRDLGNASGWTLKLEDRAGLGHAALLAARDQFLGLASQEPLLTGARPNGMEDTPELRLEIDHEKAGALSVSLAEINATLAAAWGGSYINDFIDRGRVKRVYMQADAPFRMVPEDLGRWYVRNGRGDMVSFASFMKSRWDYGPPRLERFNGMPSFEITGQAAPGISSGTAMDAIERLVEELPPGIGYEWAGISYQERQSGSQTGLLYVLSLLVVFLSLAALYESWSIPFAVLLVVPFGVLGAVLAAMLRDFTNDVYFQVGLLTTVGLSAKNAILIVEFAKAQVDQGKDLLASTLEAVRLRLRPILMTSLAFGLGVLPLAISSGAGSAARNAVGTGVLGGMILATALGVLFVPVFFVLIRKLFVRRRAAALVAPVATVPPGEQG